MSAAATPQPSGAVVLSPDDERGELPPLPLLLPATTWLWGRCGKHNSPPASSVMDFIFCRSDGSHVSVDTVHPSLLRSSSFSSSRWYHPQYFF